MATRTRLANKTIWALEDIIAAGRAARAAWRICQEIAEQRMDAISSSRLAGARQCEHLGDDTGGG